MSFKDRAAAELQQFSAACAMLHSELAKPNCEAERAAALERTFVLVSSANIQQPETSLARITCKSIKGDPAQRLIDSINELTLAEMNRLARIGRLHSMLVQSRQKLIDLAAIMPRKEFK